MKSLSYYTKAAGSLLKIKLFNARSPIAVRWQLTNKCINKCPYCNVWNHPAEEFSFEEIKDVLKQLKDIGVLRISFSGGEPLLRDDIGDIVDFTHDLGIHAGINSSGYSLAEKARCLKNVSLIKLSIDGPKQIHEKTRGQGTHDILMRAVEAARENNIRFSFAATISKDNVNHLDYILDLAKKNNTFAAFQPLAKLYECAGDVRGLFPDIKEYQRAVDSLIAEKKKNPYFIRNSIQGLEYIKQWPDYKNKIKCFAGRAFFMINTDGCVTPCDRVHFDEDLPSCKELSLQSALELLPKVECESCGFCGTQEINMLLGLDVRVLKTIRKVFSSKKI